MTHFVDVVAAIALALPLLNFPNTCSAAARWKQDTFMISEWQAPFVHAGPEWELDAEVRYKEFAGANFTVMLGGLNANGTSCTCIVGTETCCGHTPEVVQMRLCEKYGLKCVLGPRINPGPPLVERIDPAATSSSAFWGFDLADEPAVSAFPRLANISRQVAALYPGRIRFINLLPNYASSAAYNATNYSAYIDAFVKELQPDIISMDHCKFTLVLCACLCGQREYQLKFCTRRPILRARG
eukprot:COSAG02_NODE_2183_length_9581_cov_22.013394_9_plen_241_part_00